MKNIINYFKKIPSVYYKVLIAMYWLTLLSKTDSFFIIYAIMGFYFILTCKNKFSVNKREKTFIIIFSLLVSFFITCANYNVVENVAINHIEIYILYIIYTLMILFALSFYVVYVIALSLYMHSLNSSVFNEDKRINNVFLKTFLFISIIDLIILFLCGYPGTLTIDSITQISQIETGVYSNHHPYWHTMIIKFFYNLGKQYFNSANVGVFLYSLFQILCIAGVVSYANLTLYQIKVKKIFNILLPLSFVVLPYHLFFSFTMWKDVLFGGSVLLFLVSSYRIIKKINNNCIDYILFVISCFGFCLLRSNGLYAFVVVFIVSILLFKKSNIRIILIILITLVSSYYLQHNYIESKNIAEPDLIEHLSIPAQQIARVVTDCDGLTKEQLNLINKIASLDEIKDNYNPILSNGIKNLVRKKDKVTFLKDNLNEYINLYIELGLSHPIQYIEAWIDQTKGFFNGGYKGELYAIAVIENSFSITLKPLVPLFSRLLKWYGNLYFSLQLLRIFISIGFHVWIIMLMLCFGFILKNKIMKFYSLTLLAIVGTLLIATPLQSSIRYAYAIFTCIFFLIVITLKEIQNDK